MKKKKQHLIPNCYLKPWCDPTTPDGQEPYIWVHPAEGGEPRRKSPRKSFTETDRYTIESSSGDRNLRVEDTLADIETKFVGIRERLEDARNFLPRIITCFVLLWPQCPVAPSLLGITGRKSGTTFGPSLVSSHKPTARN